MARVERRRRKLTRSNERLTLLQASKASKASTYVLVKLVVVVEEALTK
jgi:hypothetical protein